MKKQILIAFFGLGGIITLLNMVGDTKPYDWSRFLTSYLTQGIYSTIFWTGNLFVARQLDKIFPWTKNPKRRFVLSILTTVTYTYFAFLFVVWIWQIKKRNDYNFLNVFRNADYLSFIITLMITIMISAIMHGREFLIQWEKVSVEAEQLKKEQISARYETLKNQVNPHFLFNSLNVLSALVHKDANLAEHFIAQLSKVYRYVLDTRDKELVSLKEELDNLEAYIFLMRMRFGENFIFDNQLSFDEKDIYLAPLTLQMLAENAIKHNEISKIHPLFLKLFKDENDFIVVQNNLQKKKNSIESTGVGLENIRARYGILSGKNIEVSESNNLFTVKIPVIELRANPKS